MKIITHALAAASVVALSATLTGTGQVTFRGTSAVVTTVAAPSARSAGFTEGVPMQTSYVVVSHGVLPTGSFFGGFNGARRAAPAERLSHLDD